MTTSTDISDEVAIDLDEPDGRFEARKQIRWAWQMVLAVIVGVILGALVSTAARSAPQPLPAATSTARAHIVVIVIDGVTKSYSMPTGSKVLVTAPGGSCSVTVDNKLIEAISGGVGAESCDTTVR